MSWWAILAVLGFALADIALLTYAWLTRARP